jgi:uncharacterized protein
MKRVAKSALLYLLRGYKWAISPMLPPACRYVPTCSEYAMEAIERHGAAYGSLKAIWRLLRCHPFSAGGYDPVVHDTCCGTEKFGNTNLKANGTVKLGGI